MEIIKKISKKLFHKKYKLQGMIQFHEGKPVVCGSFIRWMSPITIYAISETKAIKEAVRKLNNKHPLYNGKIQVYSCSKIPRRP